MIVRKVATIAWNECREAVDGRLPWVALLCVLVLVAVAEFAGEVVVNDADQLRAGTLGWGLRWLGVLTLTLYLVNSATREAADRITLLFHALPLRRETLYFGKLLGVVLLAFLFVVLAGAVVAFYVDVGVALRWSISLFFELAVVSAFALWIVTATGSAPGTMLLTLGFYLLSRAMGAMLAMAAGPYFVARSAFDAFVAQVVEILSWVLPSLHEFASADWLIRAEVDANLLLQLMQACVYMVFLAAVTLVELYRKQL